MPLEIRVPVITNNNVIDGGRTSTCTSHAQTSFISFEVTFTKQTFSPAKLKCSDRDKEEKLCIMANIS